MFRAVLVSFVAISYRATGLGNQGFVLLQKSAQPEQSEILRGKLRAERFNSRQCVDARREANLTAWQQISHRTDQQVNSGKVAANALSAELLGSTHPDMVDAYYVRNQKAGSSASINIFDNIVPDHEEIGSQSLREPNDQKECPADITTRLVLTFVGDPLEVFVAGFMETVCRTDHFLEAAHHDNPGNSVFFPQRVDASGWESLSDADAHDLFSTFLDDVESKRHLGSEAFHAWPQALKVDVGGSMCLNFIGHKDSISTAFGAMFPQALPGLLENHANTGGSDAGPDVSQCESILHSKLQITTADRKRMCNILAVDFECFDFPIPADCT